MSESNSSFYVIGGTVHPDAACYVYRQADEDLYSGLIEGEFCYVLTPRQLGKSSLMAQTAVRLREEGMAVVILDLTAIGNNATVEQWYYGLIAKTGQQLSLQDDLAEFWAKNDKLGPLQRWMQAIREVVLTSYTGKVIIFIDEIDIVRSQSSFSTDEFFAGIREFYNRRVADSELSRLTFCLLGAATPSDLIRDTRMTPFNIGRRITLTDFTVDEAAPLAEGLRQNPKNRRECLQKVLYWTGGHPCLTQRLCQSIAEDASVMSPSGVDRICKEIFSLDPSPTDDNLRFVQDRILHSETGLAGLLNIYGKVRRNKRVRDDENDPLIESLNLSGITKVVSGYLSVRNRIYRREFDLKWIKSKMPEAELRRQREAYRKGIFRAASYAGVLLMMLSIAVTIAVQQRRLTFLGRIHRPSNEAQRWYDNGMDALRNGAYHQASAAFARAIDIDDKFVMAHARLAESLMDLGYADRAKDELLRVTALVPNRSALPQMDGLYLEAISGIVLNDLPSAIKAYTEIVRLKPDDPPVYVDLGHAYEKNEDLSKAIENYVEASRRDPQYALPNLRVGVLYARQQNIAEALAAFEKSESLYVSLRLIEGQTSVFYERGQVLVNTGKLADAEAQLQRAYELANVSGNESQKINTLLHLSRLASSRDAPDKAQQYATKAIDFAQQHGLDDLLALGLNELGYAFFVSGDYVEAEKNYLQAREFAQRNRSRLREAQVLQNLATLYLEQLRTDEALAAAQQALEFFKQGGYRTDTAVCLTLIGRVNRRKGDYEAALKAFEQNLEMGEQSAYQPQIAFATGEIAMVLSEQERYPEALSHYQQSLSLNKSLNYQLGITYNSMNLGNVQWRLGQYEEARASLEQAYDLAGQPGGSYKPVLAEVHLRKAEIALSERRFADARSESEQALALGTQYEGIPVEAKFTLGLAEALSGGAREGKAACQEAVEMAKRGGDATLLSKALLAEAEVLLENDDAQGALSAALEAKDRVARAGQQESEWRACVIEARAHRRQGNAVAAKDDLTHATNILLQLKQKWGAEAFESYLTRPDIQFFHNQVTGGP